MSICDARNIFPRLLLSRAAKSADKSAGQTGREHGGDEKAHWVAKHHARVFEKKHLNEEHYANGVEPRALSSVAPASAAPAPASSVWGRSLATIISSTTGFNPSGTIMSQNFCFRRGKPRGAPGRGRGRK